MIKKIKSFDYFAGANPIWGSIKNGVGNVRINDGVYHIENTRYPKYFQYVESWDAHFCGDWYEVSKIDFQNYISKLIEEKYAEIADLKNTLMEDQSTV